MCDHLRRWGYAIIDDVADTRLLDRTRIAPFIDASAAGRDEYDGKLTGSLSGHVWRDTAAKMGVHGTFRRYTMVGKLVELPAIVAAALAVI